MSKNFFFRFILFSFFSLVALSACTEKKIGVSGTPNIVLIVIDTLRSDYLPFYGASENNTPFLNELARNGAVFTNNFATSPWTAPSTASILTSLYPIQHGILMGRRSTKKLFLRDNSVQLNKIPESVVTIAEEMKSNGYVTFGAADNGNIREDSGFAQGFDNFINFQNKGAQNLNSTIKSWKPKFDSSEKYFLYLQYMDPHHPYIEHKEYFKGQQKEGLARSIDAYKSELLYVDAKIKEIYDLLNWDKNTIILVTSDHGEEFGEHGSIGHGKNLYSEVIRVPLLLYYPAGGIQHARIDNFVSIIDSLPTLSDLSGIKLSGYHEGISLLPLLKGEKVDPRPIYSHLWKRSKKGDSIYEVKSIVSLDKRLIQSNKGKTMLFDMITDFKESNNQAKKDLLKVKELELKLQTLEASLKIFPREWTSVKLDEEDFEE